MGCLIENKNSKPKKGHNSEKMNSELSPLIVWIALWIVNKFSEFQVNIFSNNRDITKCQTLHDANDDNAKVLAQYLGFSQKTAKLINKWTDLKLISYVHLIVIGDMCTLISFEEVFNVFGPFYIMMQSVV